MKLDSSLLENQNQVVVYGFVYVNPLQRRLLYPLILVNVQVSIGCFQPFTSPAADLETLVDKQSLALAVGLVDGAIDLVEQHIIK